MRALIFGALVLCANSAVANYLWNLPYINRYNFPSPSAVCANLGTVGTYSYVLTQPNGTSGHCTYNGNVLTTHPIYRVGTSCPTGQTYNTVTGTCGCPAGTTLTNGQCVANNPCTAKAGTNTPFFQKYPSFDAYKNNCKASVDGCQVDKCGASGSQQCGTNPQGEFACWGVATYTGNQSTGSDEPTSQAPTSAPPEPTTNTSSQNCTPKPDGSGYICTTSGSTSEFSNSQCAYGNVNGVQGMHCTKPDYQPQSDTKTRTDDVTTKTNPDGSTTTTTVTKNNRTTCVSGVCTTTTTTTTTTTNKDASGNTTSQTKTCTGPNCDNPNTKADESEGEGMPGAIQTPTTDTLLPELSDDVPSYEESIAEFMRRVDKAPLFASIGSLKVPSGGSCSIGSASLFGGSVSFNDFCKIAPDVLSGLRYLFLAIWAWAAIRLFLTA